jgi:chaperonin cofactor prefoldin
MTKLVKFDVGDGKTVLIEVEEIESDAVEPVSKPIGELAAQARQSLSEALDGLTPMIRTLKNRLNALTDPADEVEVKFSVKLTAEVGAIITHLGGEATYEITLKWGNK